MMVVKLRVFRAQENYKKLSEDSRLIAL